MLLVDTSVWVAHLRQGELGLGPFLQEGRVLCHPFIIGELACANLSNRSEIISLLQALPSAALASPAEVLNFIENCRLMGKGLGYVDVHLLASARLTGVPLWTLDKRLSEVAAGLGLTP